jgi:glutamine synthetase
MLTLGQLEEEVAAGAIDTVVVAATDMQGRLVGKRMEGDFFLEHGAQEGIEGCAYLLATDMDMNPVQGYELVNWDSGYGDFHMVPDLSTLRRLPWLEATALVLCDVLDTHGAPVAASPRRILTECRERAAALALEPFAATELEFFLFGDSYAEAARKDYRDLTPTTPYLLDYHVLATSFQEPFIRQVRRGMQGAGIPVESSKGEAWPNQHEINLRYADALGTADRHVIYKTGVKEIAHQHELAATFMAKPADGIGSSCHIHLSLRGPDGASAFIDRDGGENELLRHCLGGLCAHAPELALLLAPAVNSYKRYARESWAPTSICWGRDNRTCPFRIVGHGESTRVECRIPGADVNPYLGISALLAAGLDGIERELEPPPELHGNAYASTAGERFPGSLHEAIALWEESAFAREAFGEEVWRHYLNYARTEQADFERAVTDYERRRMFERA